MRPAVSTIHHLWGSSTRQSMSGVVNPGPADPVCPQVLEGLRRETAAQHGGRERNQVAPEQGRFLAWLAEALGARRAIEVGVFTGYSSLAVALVRRATAFWVGSARPMIGCGTGVRRVEHILLLRPDAHVRDCNYAFMDGCLRVHGVVHGGCARVLCVSGGALSLSGVGVWRPGQALPEDGRLVACERDERPLELARRAWHDAGVAHKVKPSGFRV